MISDLDKNFHKDGISNMSIWAHNSASVRSSAELGLVNVEQQRQLLHNNKITSTFMAEKDARAEEKHSHDLQIADKIMKKTGLKHAKKAAELDIWLAGLNILSTVGNIASSRNKSESKRVNWASAIPDLLNGFGNLMNKILEAGKIKAEEDAVNEELGKLSIQAVQMEQGLAALLSNPYI